MTTEAAARAAQHVEEILEEIRTSGEMKPSEVRAVLRRSRIVLMEALSALRPAPVSDEPQATTEATGLDGISSQRSPIFEGTTDDPAWARGMLFAIATAKRMGAEHFEIVTKKEEVRGVAPRRPGVPPWMQGMFEDYDESYRTHEVVKVVVYAVQLK